MEAFSAIFAQQVYPFFVKVLVNSDITYSQGRSFLISQVRTLAEACRDRNFEIVVPTTTIMEFERQVLVVAAQERKALADAAALLDRFDIGHREVKPEDLIRTRSLDDLLRETGVKVEVISPSLEDFNDAHRRASLHLSPQPASQGLKKEPDEMRDLVIWAVAIRVAKEQGGALLVSRDTIHSGELGREEAASVGLSIAASVDEALRFFQIETPDAKLFIEMLGPLWDSLPALGLAVPHDLTVSEVRNARFVRGPGGVSFASATVRLPTEAGERTVVIQLRPKGDPSVRVNIDGDDPSSAAFIEVPSVGPGEDPTYHEKLNRLKNLLGG